MTLGELSQQTDFIQAPLNYAQVGVELHYCCGILTELLINAGSALVLAYCLPLKPFFSNWTPCMYSPNSSDVIITLNWLHHFDSRCLFVLYSEVLMLRWCYIYTHTIDSQISGQYASFLKGQGHQGSFSLLKSTLCGNCKFLLEQFKATKALTRGQEGNRRRQSPSLPPWSIRPGDWKAWQTHVTIVQRGQYWSSFTKLLWLISIKSGHTQPNPGSSLDKFHANATSRGYFSQLIFHRSWAQVDWCKLCVANLWRPNSYSCVYRIRSMNRALHCNNCGFSFYKASSSD